MATETRSTTHIRSVHKLNPFPTTSIQSLLEPYQLGPSDFLVSTAVPTQVLFVYSTKGNESGDVRSSEIIDPDIFQQAVEELLEGYPYLTGRLAINPLDNTPFISDMGRGAELILAKHDLPLSTYTPHDPNTPFNLSHLPEGGNPFLPPFPTSPQSVLLDNPILAIQHTRFSCGSVILGMRIHHIVCDGIGFFQVARDLAEIYRRLSQSERTGYMAEDVETELREQSSIKPYLSEFGSEETLAGLKKEAAEFLPSRYMLSKEVGTDQESEGGAEVLAVGEAGSINKAEAFVPPSTTGRYLDYSSAQIARLKRKCIHPDEPSSWTSTFTALTAYLYQTITQARVKHHQANPSQPPLSRPDFLFPMDLRQRLNLPSRYPFNALTHQMTSLPLNLLLNGSLHEIASQIHALTLPSHPSTTLEELTNTLQWIAAQPDKAAIRTKFEYGTGAVMLSAWNKIEMYSGMAFDSEPILVGPPFTPIILLDGLGYYLPPGGKNVEDKGGMTVALALSEPVWEYFDELEKEMFGVNNG